MKSTLKIAVLLFTTLLLSACGDPKLDLSSHDAFDKSEEAIKEGMTAEEVKEYKDAFLFLMFNGKAPTQEVKDRAKAAKTQEEGMLIMMEENFDGKSAKDIISMAKELKNKKKK